MGGRRRESAMPLLGSAQPGQRHGNVARTCLGYPLRQSDRIPGYLHRRFCVVEHEQPLDLSEPISQVPQPRGWSQRHAAVVDAKVSEE